LILARAAPAKADTTDRKVYWFLISSGYKTWRFLRCSSASSIRIPNCPRLPTPSASSTTSARKFGDQYGSGIVRFTTTPRRGVKVVTGKWRPCFFARANPGHGNGDELACLTEVSRANLTRAGQRMLR
jgi:hypothetical protein